MIGKALAVRQLFDALFPPSFRNFIFRQLINQPEQPSGRGKPQRSRKKFRPHRIDLIRTTCTAQTPNDDEGIRKENL